MSDVGPIHLVDPELRSMLELPRPLLNLESLPRIRESFSTIRIPPSETVAERFVPGPLNAPDVRVLTFTPPISEGLVPALLHIHGGGFVVGTPELSAMGCAQIAAEIGCLVVSVDYRLAPEAPFPAGIEDCYAVLKWLHAEASVLGVDVTRIAVGGESSGAGMAAALALMARDRREIPVCFQRLDSPMLDDRTANRSDPHPYCGHYFWSAADNRFGWESLLGLSPRDAGVSPYAAPARAEDLSCLPPAIITVGSLDLFLEESIEYARRLSRAGVPVELHVYPGAFHSFEFLYDTVLAKNAARDRLTATRRALRGA